MTPATPATRASIGVRSRAAIVHSDDSPTAATPSISATDGTSSQISGPGPVGAIEYCDVPPSTSWRSCSAWKSGKPGLAPRIPWNSVTDL